MYLARSQSAVSKIMHWLNWYTAMCFNRMLKRCGHFWEKRYHATGFANSDKRRALNTIRYIHANPQAAKIQKGFFYDFSNYGIYERLGDDGITTWHPAFLELGETLQECGRKYRGFCQNYQPREKQAKPFYWGNQLLPKLMGKTKSKSGKKKKSKAQQQREQEAREQYQQWRESHPEIVEVAEKFILANCYNPARVREFLDNYY